MQPTVRLAAVSPSPRATVLPPSVVFGENAVNNLGVARTLRRRGVPVTVVSPRVYTEERFSRLCRFQSACGSGTADDRLLNALRRVAESAKTRPVLIPTGEPFLLFIVRHREFLAEHFLFAAPDTAGAEQIADKGWQAKLARTIAVPIPETWILEPDEPADGFEDRVVYPCVIKRTQKFLLPRDAHPYARAKVVVARDRARLAECIRVFRQYKLTMVVQEVIPGDDDHMYYCESYCNAESRTLVSFTSRKIRQFPHLYGVTSACESVREPVLAEYSARITEAARYWGISDIEYKLDPRDGRFKLIEVNPRSGWYNILSERCGSSVVFTSYSDLAGLGWKGTDFGEVGVKWVHFALDARNYVTYGRKRGLNLRSWMASLRGRKVDALYAADDPLPYLAHAAGILGSGVRHLVRRALGRPTGFNLNPR